ncbi:MAG: hypothetical protein GY856_07740 [bacterium]|nr:hypothetical protein [bacterium]
MTWFQLLDSYRPNPRRRGSQPRSGRRAVRSALVPSPIMAPHEVRRIGRRHGRKPPHQDLGSPDPQRSSLPMESQLGDGESR